MTASSHTRALVRGMLPRLLTAVERDLATMLGPEFAPSGEHGGRVLDLVRVGTDVVCACAETDRPPGTEALRPFAESARLHAANGLPSQMLRLGVITSYTGVLRTALVDAAHRDRTALMPVVSWGARLGPLIEQTEMTAFLDWHRLSGHGRRWRQETVRALLSGVRLESDTTPGYLVCLIGPDPESTDQAGALLALGTALLDSGAMALRRRQFVVLVHPLAMAPTDSLPRPTDVCVPVLDQLGASVRVAAANATADAVSRAYREALGVWRLVCRHRYPAGRFDLFSVAAEHMAGADRVFAHRLHGLLAPIAESPALLDTLRQWLRHDLNRRRCAAALHVHPNTLDRRLRQIEERTGLSVTRNSDLLLLRLALAG